MLRGRKLIVNADDLGISSRINAGIIEAHSAGILKSASMLANGEAVDEALEMAKDYPQLGLGIHLTVVYGKPLSNLDNVRSLIFSQGAFARGYGQFVLRYLTGGIKINEVEYEWEKQRERLSAIKIDHIDSHQHLHLLSGLFDLTIKLALKWGVKFIRIPYENFEIGLRGPDLIPGNVLNIFCWGRKEKLIEKDLDTADNFFGSSFTGALTENIWRKLLTKVPAGLTEIMCHPGHEDENIRLKYGWKSKWEEELHPLTAPETLKLATDNGIIFTNFTKL